MLDVILNLVRKRERSFLEQFIKDVWQGETFRQRLPLLLFLLGVQLLYFPINSYLTAQGAGTTLDIPAIDSNIPTLPIFVLPYALAFILMPILPAIAAWKFPTQLFQEYMVAFLLIMVAGYTLWMVFPNYVVKPPYEEHGFLADLLRRVYLSDNNLGHYCALPSSHVYYMTLGMCYFIVFDKRVMIPFILFAVVNAVSTVFTRQHYVLDAVAGVMMAWFAYAVTKHLIIPAIRQWESKLPF